MNTFTSSFSSLTAMLIACYCEMTTGKGAIFFVLVAIFFSLITIGIALEKCNKLLDTFIDKN